jgi:hypothetical protein
MDDLDRLRRAADDLVAFCRRIDEELRETGVLGMGDLVESYTRVCDALGAVRQQDIDRGLIDIGDLVDRLRLIGARLESLGEMKRILLGADLDVPCSKAV